MEFRSLRSSAAILLKAVERKFPEAQKIVACIFFSKFICPTIRSPYKFVLDESVSESTVSEHAARGLWNLAYLLESFATGQEIASAVAKESIRKQHKAVTELINQLAVKKFIQTVLNLFQDEKTLDIMRKVVQANVIVPAADKQVMSERKPLCDC
jgi:hypothetical protein